MAIRKDIVWTVAEDGVTLLPAHPQDGGIQGEDKAVQVKFILGAEHPLVTGDYQIYIECVDATGGYDKTEVLTPDEEEGAITALVPLAWTQYGGSITLSVVGEAEAQRVILDDAHLTFRSRPGMIKRMQLLIQTYIQKLLNRAESAVGVAEKAATSANESAGKAAIARDAAQAAAQTAADEAMQAQKERVQVSNAAAVVAAQKDEATAAAASAAERAFAAQTMAQAAATSAAEAEADRASAGQILNRCREVEVDCEEYADDAKAAAKIAEEEAKRVGGLPERVAGLEKWRTAQRLVNVRDDYGAVGDGVTDDTEAIQAALHYAEETGLPLYIPAGNYLVSKTISTYTEADSDKQSNALNIYGAGMNTLFTTTEDFEGDYVLYIDYKRSQPSMLWVHDFAVDLNADVSGIYIHKMGMKSVVENLWITFKREKQEGEAVRTGIFCDSSVVATFQRIKVAGNIRGHRQGNCGIVCRRMFSTKIIDCDIILCGWAIYLSGGADNLIENCRMDENEYGVFQNSSTNIEQGTRAYKYDGSIPAEDQFCGVLTSLTIRKNRFESNNQVSIYLVSFSEGALEYLHNKQITIADNYFSGLGAGTATYTDREVFRKAMRFARCTGVSIAGNSFKGAAYDSSNATMSNDQNISIASNVFDLSLRDNVAVACNVGTDEDGNTVAAKSNAKLAIAVTKMGLLNDIELNQTTRGDVSVRRSLRVDVSASGTIDVSSGNVVRLSDGVTVSGLTISNSTDLNTSQEVTLVATGTATIKNGGIHLSGGMDFEMGQYDSVTLVCIWHNGSRWVEKCRSVNRATTVAEEG